MVCDICARDWSARRRPACASCAQAALYAPRIEQVAALVSREKAHTLAEAIVRPGNDGVIAALPEDADWDAISSGMKKHSLEKARAEQDAVEIRIEGITHKANELKEELENWGQWIAKQKQEHTRRREAVATERNTFSRHQARTLDPLRTTIKKSQHRLDKVHSRTLDARAVLCREAALLGGLQKSKGKDGRSQYWLGAVPIPDLKRLNGRLGQTATQQTGSKKSPEPKAHEEISAALDNIARLLCSCCHYLSIRLPAEITLPHADLPHAMILPEKSSYKTTDSPLPSASSSQISAMLASRIVSKSAAPRPRLLHLDRPLAQLLKDDAKSFYLFVEGVTLLAWDVAWLCKTQGVENINSFDDVCAIGRNLYQLALKSDRPMQRHPSVDSNNVAATGKEENAKATATVPLGLFSHADAQYSLQGSAGLDLFRGWRLASSTQLVDKLKNYLMNEISGAEWDILEDDEWDDEQDHEKAVLVGGPRKASDKKGTALSVMSFAPNDGTDETPAQDDKPKAGSGWTKVRGRPGDI